MEQGTEKNFLFEFQQKNKLPKQRYTSIQHTIKKIDLIKHAVLFTSSEIQLTAHTMYPALTFMLKYLKIIQPLWGAGKIYNFINEIYFNSIIKLIF